MIKNDFPTTLSQWWKEVASYFTSEVKNAGVSAAFGFTSASFLVISYLMLTCSRSEVRDAAACVLYSLIGDLCHLAGAFLSNQTFIQCIMASLMATLDVVRFISATLPLCWWKRSTTGRRARMLNRRRRQNLLVICLLSGMGACVYADIRVRRTQAAAYGSPTSRKLLNVIVHVSDLVLSHLHNTTRVTVKHVSEQDQTELLGYVLGLLSFAISWTSRIPFILKANRGEMSNSTHVSSRGCSALAGALYASAVLLYDPRLASAVKALPWILSGACSAILDVSILLLSCRRIRYKWQSIEARDSDAEYLLDSFHGVASGPDQTTKDKNGRKHISSRKISSSKMPEMEPSRNTNVQPVRRVCLKEGPVTRADVAERQPLVGVDECYSSGSATDSSRLSSELEWDFEETPPQWSSQNGDRPKTDAFPLQEWAVDQRSKSNEKSGSSARFCNSAELEETMVCRSPETNFQSPSDSAK